MYLPTYLHTYQYINILPKYVLCLILIVKYNIIVNVCVAAFSCFFALLTTYMTYYIHT